MNTAARKQVDPCFPDGHRLISARVYHGKRIISTELDAQTGTGGALATGQRPRSRPGAGRFHRYFVSMPPGTHPDGRGGVSNRRPENILTRRSKGAPHSGGHPAFFAVGHIYVRNCRILRFQRGEIETGLAPLRHLSQAAEGKAELYSRMFQGGVTECADEIFGGHHWFYREDLPHADGFPMEMFQRACSLYSDVRIDMRIF